ncbi:PhzF family phenazine biosynthesis protein [Agromyces sp. LHK192]|uniref:PhzF family phenazine biosynthesis protein n=1 Tax=Agromyces sp. LHK192 TaxID=2498704 RepID=UPI000FDA37D7|nr:PhzF family phenazine biosynthesis protein [Agromyces sp. LHK192]
MRSAPEVLRYTAFSTDPEGGNPAGVVLDAGGLDDEAMQRIAAEVDYAETAFVTGAVDDGALGIRYFSPIAEVPFCGHATVATAVALAERGRAGADGAIRFATPVGEVSIVVGRDEQGARGAFTSIEPSVSELAPGDLDAILGLLGLDARDLDTDLPPRIADAGNPHPVIVLADAPVFDGFRFDPDAVRALMDARGWPATITVLHRAGDGRYVARNLFPVGRITEDPATGSAAAAVGGYLRSLGRVPSTGRIQIEQGAHVGRPGLLTVDIPSAGGITVSGHAVPIEAPTPA